MEAALAEEHEAHGELLEEHAEQQEADGALEEEYKEELDVAVAALEEVQEKIRGVGSSPMPHVLPCIAWHALLLGSFCESSWPSVLHSRFSTTSMSVLAMLSVKRQ